MTKNGVELNLRKSKYTLEKDCITFYFSSEFYLKKFKDKVEEFVELENRKFESRYNMPINLRYYFLVVFYKRTEKRGFLIKYNNVFVENTEFLGVFSKFIEIFGR